VTVDGGASYSSYPEGRPVRIQILESPGITALNVTSRFETLDERIFIRLADPSWIEGSVV